jgi:tetratricopeptide (TPR) repeat protein
MNANMLAEPILVGREKELNQLNRYLDSAISGEGATIFISGEAGSGKTRITREFLVSAKEKGVQVLSGWCLSNAAVPFFPFVEAFESFLAESESDEVVNSQRSGLQSWLIGSIQMHEKGISPEALKDQKFAALAKDLLNISIGKPLILFIDDLHWADSASLALLHYLARTIGSERILILATFRTEELNSLAEGIVNPLLNTLRLMGREDLFSEVKLPNLERTDVSRIAENMLGGNVNELLVNRIASESQGNPLFIIESLKLLFENGSLIKEVDEWQLKVDHLAVPLKIKDIILRRLSNLKSNQRRILDVASVIGDKFDPHLLGSVLEVDSLAVLETLNSIALSKSLVSVEGDYYRFDHAKTREVLYEEILLPLRKGYHERVAERIETLYSNLKEPQVADLAHHYTQGGNLLKSIQYSNAAGKLALEKFSYPEAIRYFTYVLGTLQQDSENSEWKNTALEGLGDAYYASMMFKEATNTFETLAKVESDVKLRVLRKAMEASFFQNDLTHLQELIDESEKTISADRLEMARMWMNKGRVCTLQGNQLAGIENRRKALQVFEEEYSLSDTAWCLISMGTNLAASREGEAVASLLRSVAIFQDLKDSRWLIEAYNMAGITLGVFSGFSKEGMELVEKSIRLNEESKICDYLRLSQSNAIESWILAALGDLQGALSKSMLALSFAEKTDSFWGKGTAYSNLTIYYTMTGNMGLAEEYFGKLMKLPPEVHSNSMVNAPLATAVFLSGKGQFEKSNQIFNGTLAYLRAQANPGSEISVRLSYALSLSNQQRFEEAKEQFLEATRLREELGKKFGHVDLYPFLMAPIKVSNNQAFEVRLDLVNVSKTQGSLIKIENLLMPQLKILSISSNCKIQNGEIKFITDNFEPFCVVTAKLQCQALKSGTVELHPKIVYIAEAGETKIAMPKSVKISVLGSESQQKIEFESEISRKVFDFLASAFRRDYVKLGLTQDRSGWRTLMDLIKEGMIPKNRIYGPSGGYSPEIAHLKRQGLVEVRVFVGERGRGGKIIKLRAACEKEEVKKFILAN